MLKYLFTVFIALFSVVSVYPQTTQTVSSKVPKEYSLEAGYRYVFSQSRVDNMASHGYGGLFDYA